MVEQRSVSKLVSSPKPPEAGARSARLYREAALEQDNRQMQSRLIRACG
jgi:hypothetical protein